jgi:hypothetical protein
VIAHAPPPLGAAPRWPAWAAIATALLVTVAALASILDPAIYARETPSWTAQGLGQDWVNLVVAAPWLAITGALALGGSRRAAVLAGGGLLYAAYSFVIYAFAVHFNALFLVYCGVLGVSVFGLIGAITGLIAGPEVPRHDDRAPRRAAAATLFGIAAVFGARWLLDVVTALVRGEPPAGLAETGLVVNPVHILDLSLVLPAMVVSGIALLRRRRHGEVLAPILLGFGVLMAIAIGAMFAMMHARGIAVDIGGAALMAVIAAISLGVLVAWLRHLRG